MIKIKVCGMKDPLNVKDLVEIKPDYVGFIFHPQSPRYVGSQPDISLFLNVTSGILRAGVFVNDDQDKILEFSRLYGLDMIQLHGSESPRYCSSLRASGLVITKVFNIYEGFNFGLISPYISCCDYFLFDTKSDRAGGSGMKFNWEILNGYTYEKAFFLSGGVGPDDSGIIRGLGNRGLFAVDINSRFEISPGIKDIKLVETFIEDINN